MKTYPLMDFAAFMKWILLKRIRKIRPFWYMAYSKEDARAFLEKDCDWVYYSGHHLENRMTAFNHSYYLPQKFGIDLRNLAFRPRSAAANCRVRRPCDSTPSRRTWKTTWWSISRSAST